MSKPEEPKTPTPWEQFRAAAKRVLSVSKDELRRRERAWKKKRRKKPPR